MSSTLVRLSCVVLVVASLAGARPRAAGVSLFGAIRGGEAAAVAGALRDGADVNQRDESGATPLMYATLYADAATVRQLIERGARVNDRNTFGATALTWGAPGGGEGAARQRRGGERTGQQWLVAHRRRGAIRPGRVGPPAPRGRRRHENAGGPDGALDRGVPHAGAAGGGHVARRARDGG